MAREQDEQLTVLDTIGDNDSYERIDVEDFIYSLSMREVLILLFRASGYKPQEIAKLMPGLHTGNINDTVEGMKIKHRSKFKLL